MLKLPRGIGSILASQDKDVLFKHLEERWSKYKDDDRVIVIEAVLDVSSGFSQSGKSEIVCTTKGEMMVQSRDQAYNFETGPESINLTIYRRKPKERERASERDKVSHKRNEK